MHTEIAYIPIQYSSNHLLVGQAVNVFFVCFPHNLEGLFILYDSFSRLPNCKMVFSLFKAYIQKKAGSLYPCSSRSSEALALPTTPERAMPKPHAVYIPHVPIRHNARIDTMRAINIPEVIHHCNVRGAVLNLRDSDEPRTKR